MIAASLALTIQTTAMAKVSERLERAVQRGEVTGCVALVRRGGKTLLLRPYGFADAEKGVPMLTDTLFQVMSMTKPVTATALMMCVEDGLVNLDEPVAKYVPSMAEARVGAEKARPAPTLLHLLTHTSGLSGDDPGGISDEQKAKMTLGDYAKLLGTEPLRAHPGTEVRYSGVGFSAAAAVVEKASGMSFESFVQTRVFDRLGMKDTHFFLPPSKRDRLAQVYTGEVGALKPFAHDRYREGARFANGAGGLYSTAGDMAKFIESFLSPRSSLLSAAGTRFMTSVQTGDLTVDGNRERGFGVGWAVVRRSPASTTLRPAGSFGHTGAFGTGFWADPKSGTVAVFLAQTFLVPEDARRSFDTLVAAACCDR